MYLTQITELCHYNALENEYAKDSGDLIIIIALVLFLLRIDLDHPSYH